MVFTVWLLVIIIILLTFYIIFLQLQVHSINRQLDKRLAEKTRQPISLQLLNNALNTLAININKCLKVEEVLRLNGIREEKRFRELIAYISHDLRTPLTAIKGYQQLMQKGELTQDQQKKLQIAQKHADELGRLIEQFFEYAYLLNVEQEINLERINLTNLVTECLVASVHAMEEKNLEVHLEETPSVFVHVDKEMVMRILRNLIGNCAAHSSGDIVVRVLIMESAVISFRNPVRNASEMDVERLFDRFYTGDKARSNTTGLGLSIVRLLAEQMGGSAGATLQNGLLDIQVKLPLFNE